MWGAAAALLLTGCIDNKYDLSDVDTTSEFRVNNLTIPVNLDPVVLSDIIKVEEGDQLKDTTINGRTFYAVVQKGTFSSDPIDVNSFYAEPDPMTDKTATFRPVSGGARVKSRAGEEVEMYYLVEPVSEELEYTATGIDKAIKALDMIYFKPLNFSIEISTSSLGNGIESALENLVIVIPSGLNVTKISAGNMTYPLSSYNPASGELDLQSVAFENNKVLIEVTATGIDLSHYPGAFNYDEKMMEGNFMLISQFNIQDSRLALSGPATELASIEEITYNVHYLLEELEATAIMGNIEYDLSGTGLDIDPVDLTNLPSFLEDPETDLQLSNPQIYLQLMNPIGHYGLYYESNITIVAEREGENDNFPGPMVSVPAREGTFNYVMAPQPDKDLIVPMEYSSDLRGLEYPRLGSILAGEGLPKQLMIDIVDPMVPETATTAPFELGQNIEGMEGSYMFLAPLSLKEGSTIVKTVDGWWTEDLSDLNIEYLTISADATNGLPTGVILNLYAIDRDGNRISSEGTLVLNENAVNEPIVITVTGMQEGETFNNLDGIRLYVIAGTNDGQPLAPDQVITLENLKAKVTGNYTRKL